jgi:hypothetical protein
VRRAAPALLVVLVAACGSEAAEDSGRGPAAGQATTAVATTVPATPAPTTATAPAVTTVAPSTSPAAGPGYALPADATAEVERELTPPPVVDSPEELAQEFAAAILVREKGCEVAPTAAVTSVTAGEPATAVVETTFGCDDSLGGARYTLTMDPDDALGWVVVSATVEYLCLRGGAGQELCI